MRAVGIASRRNALLTLLWIASLNVAAAWVTAPARTTRISTTLFADTTRTDKPPVGPKEENDYEVPEDAVVNIKPAAMKRLRELKGTELKDPDSDTLILRMGVRSGGCSGMSYVMDFSNEGEIQEDDAVDEYPEDKIKCVVDAKSMLYLYGLELNYSTELIGGGFQFYNPNAEESCGCGSSFGV